MDQIVTILCWIFGCFFVGALALGQFREESKLVGVLMILGWSFVSYMAFVNGVFE